MNRTIPDDTIAAISTPPGESGIGIVRLSGSRSTAIAASVFQSSSGRDVRKGGRQLYHGEICSNGAAVDEVLLVVMRAPHSYTREDPIINDHLGDIYWAVGRKNEAAFQWNRALMLEPEKDIIPKIELKLKEGLPKDANKRKGI